MKFNLRTPCDNCPFRSDITFFLDPRRVTEILDALLLDGKTFSCHKTVHYDDDGEPSMPHGDEQHCAGALIMLERFNLPNQMMRIAERLGLYDPRHLAMEAPVFASPAAMLERMRDLDETTRRGIDSMTQDSI